jgi:hypothetical protein
MTYFIHYVNTKCEWNSNFILIPVFHVIIRIGP